MQSMYSLRTMRTLNAIRSYSNVITFLQVRPISSCTLKGLPHSRPTGYGTTTPSAQTWHVVQKSSSEYVSRRWCSGSSTKAGREYYDDIPVVVDPVKGEQVYIGSIQSIMKRVKCFSLFTSFCGASLQPFMFKALIGMSIPMQMCYVTFTGALVLGTPMMLQFITGRYVTEIYRQSKTGVYTATTLSLFLRKKDTPFLPVETEDVSSGVPVAKLAEGGGILSTIKVGKKPLFIVQQDCFDPYTYTLMMGYDKPMDWSFPEAVKSKEEIHKE